jgi:hypothetical protein
VTRNIPANMNKMLVIRSASGVLAPDEAPAITDETTKSEKSLKRGATNFIRMSPSLWRATELLEFAGVFALLYLIRAIAFGVALLFYTFTDDPNGAGYSPVTGKLYNERGMPSWTSPVQTFALARSRRWP